MLSNLTLDDIGLTLPGGLVVVASDGRIADANAAGWMILGGKSRVVDLTIQNLFLEADEKVERYLGMCRRNRQAVPGRLSIKGADGGCNFYVVRGAAIASGNPGDVILHLEDAASSSHGHRFVLLNQTIEQLRLEVKTRQNIEAVLEAEKQTLASVFDGKGLIDALQILAKAVEEHSDGMLVSILLVDEDQRLRHAVAPSLPKSYIEAIDGVPVGPNVGSCGTAAYTGETVIATDISTDPNWQDYREVALAANLHACWSAPILSSSGTALGTLALYYRARRQPTQDELRLISNSAYVASAAIERFRSQESLSELLRREYQAREKAEAQNRAKDEFLAMLGHELRNPLSAINNATLALQAGAETGAKPESDKLIQIVLREIQQLKRILDDLLDISRLSRGKLQLQMQPVNADDFADTLASSVLACHPHRAIQFEIADGLGLIEADPARLQQSVQNLIDNAVKYSSAEDDVSVSISSDSDAVRFKVVDTGRGIEPDRLQRVFEPFEQLDVSIDRQNSGLGLGLALVKRFAIMHGGDVAVGSEGAGRGSQFTLTIPRGPVQDSVPCPAQTDHPTAFARQRILVVEDNDGAREGLCGLLELWGHDVLSAADGKTALKIIHEACPQVAIVDIGLPVMDGYAVAQAVRKTSPPSAITLIALTGYGQDSDRKRAIDAGFDRHLVKPADVQELMEIFGEPD